MASGLLQQRAFGAPNLATAKRILYCSQLKILSLEVDNISISKNNFQGRESVSANQFLENKKIENSKIINKKILQPTCHHKPLYY
jgi:hypothetical protein